MTSSSRFIISLSCPDRPGIVHAVTGAILGAEGNILESQQYDSQDTGSFFLRVQVETDQSEERLRAELEPLRSRFGMSLDIRNADSPLRTLILCSTAAHALNELLFQAQAGSLPIEVPVIVSNHQSLAPLAEYHGVPFEQLTVTPETKPASEARILELIEEHDIELVVLARYMQILSDDFCRALEGRAINIHHSFLPSFKGAKPYHQAYARGVKLIGATAHYVTADLDEGPIIDQDVVRVRHDRTPEQLVEQGRTVEAQTLARAVRWHAERRVLLDGHRTVVFD
ncbi:MAG: formyltetrahydrofolate deformylase [Galactobacter sp.]